MSVDEILRTLGQEAMKLDATTAELAHDDEAVLLPPLLKEAKRALYQRLASEAVDVLRATEVDQDEGIIPLLPMKVVPLSKLAEVFGVKE